MLSMKALNDDYAASQAGPMKPAYAVPEIHASRQQFGELMRLY
jgi:hypothetical protein